MDHRPKLSRNLTSLQVQCSATPTFPWEFESLDELPRLREIVL